MSGVVYKFQYGLCNESYYGESIIHLDIKSGEHIGVSHLTGKKFKRSFDNFSILAHKKTYLSEIKESLLIMGDKLSLNSYISSAPLHLFDKVS